jgi:hypothetical protein
MDQLSEDGTLGPMMNLQCSPHVLSLLMKDLRKHFPWVKEAFQKVLFTSYSVMAVRSCGFDSSSVVRRATVMIFVDNQAWV